MTKNGPVYEGGKVKTNNATPKKLFSVYSYDLKSLSFKFGNDIFITFEIPWVAYNRPVLKINILLLFRPSVIRVFWRFIPLQFVFFNLTLITLLFYNYEYQKKGHLLILHFVGIEKLPIWHF
jgi:hypothetical protein